MTSETIRKINEAFPNSRFVPIRSYNHSLWKRLPYNFEADNRAPLLDPKNETLSAERADLYSADGYRIGWVVPSECVAIVLPKTGSIPFADIISDILKETSAVFWSVDNDRVRYFIFKERVSCTKVGERMNALCIPQLVLKDASGYIVLPDNDPHVAADFSAEEVGEIPAYMRGAIAQTRSVFRTMCGVSDPNGELMVRWKKALSKTQMFSPDEIDDAMTLINAHIIAEPMDDDDFVRVVIGTRPLKERELAAESGINTVLSNTHEQLALEELAKKAVEDYSLVYTDARKLYSFDKNYYKRFDGSERLAFVNRYVRSGLSSKARVAVIQFIELIAHRRLDEMNKSWYRIACKNGVLNLITGELEPPSKDDLCTVCVPWNYNDDPIHSPKVDEFITSLATNEDGYVDAGRVQLLYQLAGYCLLRANKLGKFFVLYGLDRVGKTMFQDLIVKLVGEDNRSRVSIDKLGVDLQAMQMIDKLVNIDDDDVDGKKVKFGNTLKSIVTDSKVPMMLYGNMVDARLFPTMIFSCSTMPLAVDKTSDLESRMIVIPINNIERDLDILFIESLTDSDMEYFFNKAVKWIGIALKERGFRVSGDVAALPSYFRALRSPVNEWIYEKEIRLCDVYGKKCSTVHKQFMDWAVETGAKSDKSLARFEAEMCQLYNVVVGDAVGRGVSSHVFVREREPSASELTEMPF